MSKYIDADRIRTEIERQIAFLPTVGYSTQVASEFIPVQNTLNYILSFIDSLQQEQLPGIEKHGVPGKDFIPVEWVDACEKYGKWKIIKQEQPSLPDNLDEAAREIVIKMHPCMEDCTILGDRLTRGQLMALVKAGVEWMANR